MHASCRPPATTRSPRTADAGRARKGTGVHSVSHVVAVGALVPENGGTTEQEAPWRERGWLRRQGSPSVCRMMEFHRCQSAISLDCRRAESLTLTTLRHGEILEQGS